ncbi:type II toxin-antitoxin system HicB family antitoxin [Burkholderia multivorans]|uniref:Arc family DNA-binding protein n=1 Tax=Burkholderia multivorans TaxID=87883 RepID=UPI001C22C70A|nr:Arc family DNA-binding protein [Burkholderia multivorans]MBU9146472.1 type II toxin-antitoxin system HicB family antitoxin [Burkholderia multivorans]
MAQDDYTKLQVRLPKQLHAKLQDAAANTGKSMNAEIIERLDETFEGDERVETLTSALKSLLESHESLEAMKNAYKRALEKTATMMELSLAVAEVSKGSPMSTHLVGLAKTFAVHMSKGDWTAAMEPVVEMMEIGKRTGVLGDDNRLTAAANELLGRSKVDDRDNAGQCPTDS